jgi:hypothetical protein
MEHEQSEKRITVEKLQLSLYSTLRRVRGCGYIATIRGQQERGNSCQLHALTALIPEERPSVTEQEAVSAPGYV